MKLHTLNFLWFITFSNFTVLAYSNNPKFTENKGQISDQFFRPRPDVLFNSVIGDLSFFLLKDGLSYQLTEVNSWKEVPLKKDSGHSKIKIPDKITVQRIDIKWLNCFNEITIYKNRPLQGYTNYYMPVCPSGVHNVQDFEEVVYQNIYTGIDLKWYFKENRLKYDYIVRSKANYKKIQFRISGAKKLFINSQGELIIETPFGNIVEQSPVVAQNQKVLASEWLLNGEVVSFDIKGVDSTKPFVIDPGVRTWGTYYGGNGDDQAYASATDSNGNVYMSGFTSTNPGSIIATTGSHQSTFGSPGGDAYVVKFNSSGIRQWGTYYGGSDNEFGLALAVDPWDNIYMSGSTNSVGGTAIATPGSHQPAFSGTAGNGTEDAYLVKFNSAGVRQWATYYGGPNNECAYGCATDLAGNVYISGSCEISSGTSIATPGSHQPSHSSSASSDAFLVKFNAAGTRLWGTYYGGGAYDCANSCATDSQNNVYIAGQGTDNLGSTVIATPGCFLFTPDYSGMCFLAKFNTNGVRQWGTYYGGSGLDYLNFCTVDPNDNIYICGETTTTTNGSIASGGSHQPGCNGGRDAYLAKFDPNGSRLWATYYGGSGTDRAWSCTTDIIGNVILAGSSDSNTGIATAGSHQTILAGGECDAFLVKFKSNGTRQWGTYYGGGMIDYGRTTSVDDIGNIYLGGYTSNNTGTVIASTNGHQTMFGGLDDGYLAQFFECISLQPVLSTSQQNLSICDGNSTTLSASGQGIVNWFSSSTSTTILNSGLSFTTPTLTAGVYTYYVGIGNCNTDGSRASQEVTVHPLPILNIASSSDSLCSGQSATLLATGALTYSWQPLALTSSSAIVSPGATVILTLTGADSYCSNTSNFTLNVTLTPTVSSTPMFYLCSGNATLLASGAQDYLWLPANITGSLALVSPSVTTNYTLVGANGSCTNSAISTVSIGVSPPLFIHANINSGCKGACFTFTNSSEEFTPFTFYWGDSSFYSPMTLEHCFAKSGTFPVRAQAFYTTGCSVISANVESITVYPLPTPVLQLNNSSLQVKKKNVILDNLSSGADTYTWNFGDGSPSFTETSTDSQVHVYSELGNYCTLLIAKDTIHGCKDSTRLCIDIICETEINVPNVFTPNQDGINDRFQIASNCINYMHCVIFDRWGNEVFQWTGTQGYWDGLTTARTFASEGAFFYIVECVGEAGDELKKAGWVELMR